MSDIVNIPLFNADGTRSEFQLRVATVKNNRTYYLTKVVVDYESSSTDKTIYQKIVMRRVEDPLSLAHDGKRLFINAEWLNRLEC